MKLRKEDHPKLKRIEYLPDGTVFVKWTLSEFRLLPEVCRVIKSDTTEQLLKIPL